MAEAKSADIEPLRSPAQWSAKAVAFDAANRADHGDYMICLWIDPADGAVGWSKSKDIPLPMTAALAAVLSAMVDRHAGQILEDEI